MRCLFCKKPTANSKSVEHIFPESIGNKKYYLPCGFVCDSCNNYFSHSVEGPLLSHASFRNLRAWYQVPTKKGVMPRLHGFVVGTDIEIGMRIGRDGKPDIKAERNRDQAELERLVSGKTGQDLMFLFEREFDPPRYEMSRFMAKMALEVWALRLSYDYSLVERLIDDPHFDRIRNWTRRGSGCDHWPYHLRRIFPEETLMRHPSTNEWVQAGYSHDLFITKRRETYFAFALFGYEFVMNTGGPSIRGFEEWMNDHQMISPLVERVGFSLDRSVQNGAEKFFIVGEGDMATGARFDRDVTGYNLDEG